MVKVVDKIRRGLLIVLSFVIAFGAIPAQAESAKPKLVLLIVADQFPFEYLSRFRDHFGTGGFRMLQERGAGFSDCRYADATTQTSVGHSVIATGAYPWSTGIVGDRWYDSGRGKTVSSVNEEIGGVAGTSGPSAKFLAASTIGDQIKLASAGHSKVFSISLKPDAALLLGGRGATASLWWDTKTGAFVSSSQFGRELPLWAKSFNDQHFADKYVGKPWQHLVSEDRYASSTRDDYPYERSIAGDSKQFPHQIGGTPGEAFNTNFAMTPFANDMLVDLAKAAIDSEALGQHGDTDMLCLSLSAGEALGQSFGPHSQEVEDLCLRMDQALANLFQYVDQKVGMSNCVVVFTSDHGVSPIPEYLKENGQESGRIDPKVFKNLLNSAIVSRLGPGDWIEAFEPPNLYLNASTIGKQKFRQPDVEALAAKLTHSVAGIAEAYAAFQFYTNQLPNGPLVEAVRKSYYWGRSGELYIVPKPGFIFDSEINGTQSGSPYNYDCHVPLFIMGGLINPGWYGMHVSPADIAPTVTGLLGIDQPSLCEGHALWECLHIPGPQRAADDKHGH